MRSVFRFTIVAAVLAGLSVTASNHMGKSDAVALPSGTPTDQPSSPPPTKGSPTPPPAPSRISSIPILSTRRET